LEEANALANISPIAFNMNHTRAAFNDAKLLAEPMLDSRNESLDFYESFFDT
jgi:hypothetical protein